MKLSYFVVIVSFFSFFFVNCTNDEMSMNDETNDLVAEAKKYFEQNASDLQVVRVGANGRHVSRNTGYSSRVIVPDWKRPGTSEHGDISTVAIPLNGDVYTKSVYSRAASVGKSSGSFSDVNTELIVQKHNRLNQFRSFVVTMIGDKRNGKKAGNSFVDCQVFSGLMIISDLEGNYLDAYLYNNGAKKRVILARAAGIEKVDPSEVVASFSLLDANRAGMYTRSGESGGGSQPRCRLCGQVGCSEDCEVVVLYCRTCNRPAENCICCGVCDEHPCVCRPSPPVVWVCPDCLSPYCDGGCQTSPSPDPNPGESHAEGEVASDWWGPTHNNIIKNALGDKLTDEQLQAVKDGSAWADTGENQKTDKAHWHAMSREGEDYKETSNRMKGHFEEFVQNFRTSNDYSDLGVALHMIMDTYSPPHNLKVWKNNLWHFLPHAFEAGFLHYEKVDMAEQAVAEVYDNLMNSDYANAGEVYDAWAKGPLGPLHPDNQK